MTTATIKLFRIFTVETPHGTFTRGTATPYTHVVVRESEVARKVFEKVQAGDEKAIRSAKTGVEARFVKDRGHVTTWHASEKAALQAAAAPYIWDPTSSALGVFPVAAPATTPKPAKPARPARTKPTTAAGEQDAQPANPPAPSEPAAKE